LKPAWCADYLADRAADHGPIQLGGSGVGGAGSHPAAHVRAERQGDRPAEELAFPWFGNRGLNKPKSLSFGSPAARLMPPWARSCRRTRIAVPLAPRVIWKILYRINNLLLDLVNICLPRPGSCPAPGSARFGAWSVLPQRGTISMPCFPGGTGALGWFGLGARCSATQRLDNRHGVRCNNSAACASCSGGGPSGLTTACPALYGGQTEHQSQVTKVVLFL
jgi:hypothetical protein